MALRATGLVHGLAGSGLSEKQGGQEEGAEQTSAKEDVHLGRSISRRKKTAFLKNRQRLDVTDTGEEMQRYDKKHYELSD
jgi:hypothetical protein